MDAKEKRKPPTPTKIQIRTSERAHLPLSTHRKGRPGRPNWTMQLPLRNQTNYLNWMHISCRHKSFFFLFFIWRASSSPHQLRQSLCPLGPPRRAVPRRRHYRRHPAIIKYLEVFWHLARGPRTNDFALRMQTSAFRQFDVCISGEKAAVGRRSRAGRRPHHRRLARKKVGTSHGGHFLIWARDHYWAAHFVIIGMKSSVRAFFRYPLNNMCPDSIWQPDLWLH